MLCLFRTSAWGAENVPSAMDIRLESVEETLQTQLRWRGELEAQLNGYQRPGSGGQPIQEAVTKLHLKPDVQVNPVTQIHSDLLFRADAWNSTRNTVRADEVYLKVNLNPELQWHAGKILYHWGNAPVLSPTDVLNPYDYYDLTQPDKLGVLATDLLWTPSSSFSMQFGVIPVFQSSRIVDETSRWINYSELVNDLVLPRLSLPANYPSGYQVPAVFNTDTVDVNLDLAAGPDPTFNKEASMLPQLFMRTSYKTISLDGSFLYAIRYNPLPSDLLISTTSTMYDFSCGKPRVSFEVLPFYELEHVVGLNFDVPIGINIFYLDSTLTVPFRQNSFHDSAEILGSLSQLGYDVMITQEDIENSSKRSAYFNSAFGFRTHWAKLNTFLQYSRVVYVGPTRPGSLLNKIIPQVAPGLQDFTPNAIRELTSGTLSTGLGWELNKIIQIKTGGLYNLLSPSYLIELGAETKVAEGVHVVSKFDYINGRAGGLFRRYIGNSKLTLGLNVVF